jgi:hypothetical protein
MRLFDAKMLAVAANCHSADRSLPLCCTGIFIDTGVVRPGVEAILKLLPHFRLGVYTCFSEEWMADALCKVSSSIQEAAGGGWGHAVTPRMGPGLAMGYLGTCRWPCELR